MDPLRPLPVDLANFIGYLFETESLAPASLRVARAAVSSTIKQLGGPSFSDHPLLHDLMRAASLRAARSPVRVPAWDLFVVLRYLRAPPFEPLAGLSLRDLTLKTVFLVSLASGRRCSEVHAFSGLPHDIALEPDGSMSLRFLPDFLAKNQDPSAQAPVVSIPSLTSVLDEQDEDRYLCPVRALRRYLRMTRHFRGAKRRLFISWNSECLCDIRKSSIARWLTDTIKAAYAALAPSTSVLSPKAHEIRAWSASLAFAQTRDLRAVLDAAYWRSPATFIQHYLRDVARLREDGSLGIASAVVAQRVVGSSSSSL